MKTKYKFKYSIGYFACLSLLITSGCKVESIGEAPSDSSSQNPIANSYDIAFYNNLISSGMSQANAEYVSGYYPNSISSAANLQSLNLNILASDTGLNAKSSISRAMAAVSNDSYFPSASDKQNAINKIANAQIITISDLVDDSQVSVVVNDVAGSLVSDVEKSGLSGDDLKAGLKSNGEGVAKGILNASVDTSLHDDLVGEFSKGAVDGLLNNPQLSSSGVDLIGALTEGIISEVGGGVHTGEGKGLIIKELLNGVKNQINNNSNLTENDKEDYVVNIWDRANSPIFNIGDSNFLDTVEGGLFNENYEVHVISVYQAGTSSGWTTGPGGEMVSNHWDGNATVNIATGTKPVVLVLTSYEGVNWHLTGATNRVAKVIMHGYYEQFVDTVSSSIVEKFSYESGTPYFYGILSGSNWFYNSDYYWVKAFLVRVRQIVGSKITSFQGAYDQTNFSVGMGGGSAVSLPAISFARPWIYSSSPQLTAYDTAGAPSILAMFYLTHKLTTSVTVRVWVENVTTSSDDIPAFDRTYTINAGANSFMALIPFTQDGSADGPESFKVHVEVPNNILNVQPVVNGIIN